MDAETTQTQESTDSTEAYLKVLEFLHTHQKKLIIGVVVAAVIAVIFAFMSYQKNQTEAEANNQLMSVPLAALTEEQAAGTAAAAFLNVAKKYPDTSSGEYAQLLAAEALFTDGKYPDAYQQFSKFIEDHADSALLAQAKIGLAAALEAEGKIADATQKYQEIALTYAADPNIVLPLRLVLGRLYEEQNKPEQALTCYSELARLNDPHDPWVAEARERGQMLLMKNPALREKLAQQQAQQEAAARQGGLNLNAPAKTPPNAPATAAPAPKTTPAPPPAAGNPSAK